MASPRSVDNAAAASRSGTPVAQRQAVSPKGFIGARLRRASSPRSPSAVSTTISRGITRKQAADFSDLVVTGNDPKAESPTQPPQARPGLEAYTSALSAPSVGELLVDTSLPAGNPGAGEPPGEGTDAHGNEHTEASEGVEHGQHNESDSSSEDSDDGAADMPATGNTGLVASLLLAATQARRLARRAKKRAAQVANAVRPVLPASAFAPRVVSPQLCWWLTSLRVVSLVAVP